MIGSLFRTFVTIILITGVALLIGFRPTTNLVDWLKALGLTALFALSITWVGVAFGIVGKTPAGANTLSQIIQALLPFTSSAFINPDTMASSLSISPSRPSLIPCVGYYWGRRSATAPCLRSPGALV